MPVSKSITNEEEEVNSGRLQGRVAIVTGASSGIGRSIVRRFAKEGAAVVVSSRTLRKCEEVADEITADGGHAVAIACDVTNEAAVVGLFTDAISQLGPIDIAVANAGISGGTTTIEDYNLVDWERLLQTNLTGVFLTLRESFRHMKAHGGSIIVMSSQAGLRNKVWSPRLGPCTCGRGPKI